MGQVKRIFKLEMLELGEEWSYRERSDLTVDEGSLDWSVMVFGLDQFLMARGRG